MAQQSNASQASENSAKTGDADSKATLSVVHGRIYVSSVEGKQSLASPGREIKHGETVEAKGSSAAVIKIAGLGEITIGHDESFTLDDRLIELLKQARESSSIDGAINFDALAQAIEEGSNLEQLLPETAAGEDSASNADGSAAGAVGVRFEFTAQRVDPNSGFNTNAESARSFDGGVDVNDVPLDYILAANNSNPTTNGIPLLSIDEDVSILMDFSSAFSDADSDQTLSYTIIGLPEGLNFDPVTGVLSGTPTNTDALNNGGVYSVTVTAQDDSGAPNNAVSATFDLIVNNVNDAPTVEDAIQLGNVAEDMRFDFTAENLLQGADDIDLDTLLVSDLQITSGSGVLEMNEDGSFSFVPDPNWYGEVVFSYLVDDGNGGTVPQQAFLTVDSVNDLPIANIDGPFSTTTNQPFTFSPLANDVDADGDQLSLTSISAENGTLIVNDDGTVSYTPNDNYFGEDIIHYQISDGNGGVSESTAAVTVIYNGGVVSISEIGTTDDSTPTFSGNSSNIVGDITLNIAGTEYFITPNDDGTWEYTLTDAAALADGNYSISASGEDDIGNIALAEQDFVVDAYQPGLTINNLDEVSTSTPVLSGTVENTAGDLTLTVNGVQYNVTPLANGTWSFEIPASDALTDGNYSATITGRDQAGNLAQSIDDFIVDAYVPEVTIDDLTVSATNLPTFSGSSANTDGNFTLQVNGTDYVVTPASDGSWSLTLPSGAELSDGSYTATILASDAQGNSVSASDAFIVDAVDDDPIVEGEFTGVVVEGNLGDLVQTTGSISIEDPDVTENPEFANVTIAGSYGELTLVAGEWTYTLNQALVQSFNAGDFEADVITLTASDGTEQAIAITITGTDDLPIVTGDFIGAVSEGNIGEIVQASGSLSISDVDSDDTPLFDDATLSGSYGVLILENGNWVYTLDQSTVQQLNPGDLVTDNIILTASDGTVQEIVLTINGANDLPVVTGDLTANISEADVGDLVQASGLLSISDADSADSPEFADTTIAGTYGSFSLVAGTWTYTLNQNLVQDLDAGDLMNDVIALTATDGTLQNITISIEGTDDAPVVTGDFSGDVSEANIGDLSQVNGALSIADVDGDDAPVFADTTVTGSYGSLVLAAGQWTYTLDQNLVQDLDAGDLVSDTLILIASDGTEQAITIAISGTDDGAIIGGTHSASINEANVGDLVQASGSISITDVDSDDSPVFSDITLAGAYGDLELIAGTWTYTLNQSLVQSMDAGDVLLDTITLTASNGMSQEIEVTINGSDDLPIVSGVLLGSVSEADIGDLSQASGSVAISDVDADDTPSFLDTSIAGTYGSLDLVAGNWTYTLDQSLVQSLNAAEVIVDTITLTATDGTNQDIVITITGTDDAPIVSGDFAASISEADVGDLVQAVGSLSISDVDSADSPVFADTTLVGSYGTLVLNAGTWTYTLDQSSVQELDAGDVVVDTLNMTASDGTSQNILINITGTDDTPVISGDFSADITEADPGDIVQASGVIAITDADADDAPVFANTTVVGSYGSLDLVDGAWTYTLNQNLVQTLEDGEVVSDVLTLVASDGSAQFITINITGTNDAPVAQAANESIGNDSPFNGNVTATDVDGSIAAYSVVSDVAEGSLVFNADGSYIFDAGNDFDDLGIGESRDVSFTYRAQDDLGADSNNATVTFTVNQTSFAPVVSLTVSSAPPQVQSQIQGFDGTAFPNASGASHSDANGIESDNLLLNTVSNVTIDFVRETAGNDNTVGWYRIGSDGSILDVDIFWANTNNIDDEDLSIALNDVPAGEIGFFLVSDGYASDENRAEIDAFQSGTGFLRFENSAGELASSTDSDVSLVYYAAGDQLNPSGAGIELPTTHHSNYANLNIDGLNHVASGSDGVNMNSLLIGFEDLYPSDPSDPDDGPDWDLRDAVFSVSIENVGLNTQEIASSLSITDDGTELSAASVQLTDARLGDELWISSSFENLADFYGISHSYDAGTRTFLFSGSASISEYEEVLQGINIANSEEPLGDTIRQVTYTVVDSDGYVSQPASLTVGSSAYDYSDSDFIQGVDGSSIVGGEGDDILSGSDNTEQFVWLSGDDGSDANPAIDSVVGFSIGAGGDSLSLSDLLVGESSDALTLDSYLSFSSAGGNTTIDIDVDGAGAGGVTQQIVLEGVDLSVLGTDQQIIQQLLNDGNLLTD